MKTIELIRIEISTSSINVFRINELNNGKFMDKMKYENKKAPVFTDAFICNLLPLLGSNQGPFD